MGLPSPEGPGILGRVRGYRNRIVARGRQRRARNDYRGAEGSEISLTGRILGIAAVKGGGLDQAVLDGLAVESEGVLGYLGIGQLRGAAPNLQNQWRTRWRRRSIASQQRVGPFASRVGENRRDYSVGREENGRLQSAASRRNRAEASIPEAVAFASFINLQSEIFSQSSLYRNRGDTQTWRAFSAKTNLRQLRVDQSERGEWHRHHAVYQKAAVDRSGEWTYRYLNARSSGAIRSVRVSSQRADRGHRGRC